MVGIAIHCCQSRAHLGWMFESEENFLALVKFTVIHLIIFFLQCGTWVILVTSYCHFRAHLGWMFEPEDSATEDQKRPSEAGFYAIILDKVIDEVRFVQSHFVFSYSYSYFVFSYSYSYFVFSYSLYEVTLCFNFFFLCLRILWTVWLLELE